MRILSYSDSDQLAECRIQQGKNLVDIEIRDLEIEKFYNRDTEDFDIKLISYDGYLWSEHAEMFLPFIMDAYQEYDFKRGLLEYIDFESESDMFDGGDREGSCW